MQRDERYRDIVLDPIRVCAAYKPRMGFVGITELSSFQEMYRADPLYGRLGLDNRLMYAAHKAAGGMSSIYRQIGIGCERLFRQVLMDELGIGEDDAKWSYELENGSGKSRTVHLDARIPIKAVKESKRRMAIVDWVDRMSADVGVDDFARSKLAGVVFEVRQGCKSKDSKRQNADISSAAYAHAYAYLPCMAVLSRQIDSDIENRYCEEKMAMLTGASQADGDSRSVYAFMKQVVGYDLDAFFARNSGIMRAELDSVLASLLGA